MNLIKLGYRSKTSHVIISGRFFMKNAFKIAFVIIGSLVGAGFASGKEIFSFFFIYDLTGIVGIFVSCFLITLVIYKVLKKENLQIVYQKILEKYLMVNITKFQLMMKME